MYQGHPFLKGVHAITESAPPSSLRRPVVGLRNGPGTGGRRARPKLRDYSALHALPNVKSLFVTS